MTLDTVQEKKMNWKIDERSLLLKKISGKINLRKDSGKDSLSYWKKIKQFSIVGLKKDLFEQPLKKNQWPLLSLIYWEQSDLEAEQSYFSGILFGVVVFIGSGAVWAKAFDKGILPLLVPPPMGLK
jgi:hypothetical protein